MSSPLAVTCIEIISKIPFMTIKSKLQPQIYTENWGQIPISYWISSKTAIKFLCWLFSKLLLYSLYGVKLYFRVKIELKRFGRKRQMPNRGTLPEFSWRDSRKDSVRIYCVPAGILTKTFSITHILFTYKIKKYIAW